VCSPHGLTCANAVTGDLISLDGGPDVAKECRNAVPVYTARTEHIAEATAIENVVARRCTFPGPSISGR
jgi:hypothetical protein